MFRPRESIESEFLRIKELREASPLHAEQLMITCNLFIDFCKNKRENKLKYNENFNNFCNFLYSIPRGMLLQWGINKGAQEAAIACNTNILIFMIENGLPITSSPYLDLINKVIERAYINDFNNDIKNLDDYYNVSDEKQEFICEILQVLINSGLYINSQRKRTYYTPLHFAIQRHLYKVVEYLINNDADINAVADNDMMPLLSAEKSAKDYNIYKNKDDINDISSDPIVQLLNERNAKRTWRKLTNNNKNNNNNNNNEEENKNNDENKNDKWQEFQDRIKDNPGYMLSTDSSENSNTSKTVYVSFRG